MKLLTTFIENLDQESKIATCSTIARSLHGMVLAQIRAQLRADSADMPDDDANLDTRNEQDIAAHRELLDGRNMTEVMADGIGQDTAEAPIFKAERYLSAHDHVVSMLYAYKLTPYQTPQSFEAMLQNMIDKPRAQSLDRQMLELYAQRGMPEDRVRLMKENQAKQGAKYLEQDKDAIMAIFNSLEIDDSITIDDLTKDERISLAERAGKSLIKQADSQYARATKPEHFTTGDLLKATGEALIDWANTAERRTVVKANAPAVA